jgi:hypothetical protein
VRTCIGDVRGQEREERGTGGAVLCELSLPPRYEYVREEEATRRVVWRRRRAWPRGVLCRPSQRGASSPVSGRDLAFHALLSFRPPLLRFSL